MLLFADHNKGSHGNPGIYFKYDVSALKVVIKEDRENVIKLLIRLCSVIAGIIVICGFCNSIIQAVFDKLFGYLLPTVDSSSVDGKLNLLGGSVSGAAAGMNERSGFTKTNLLLTNDMLHDNGGLAPSQFIPFK